MHPNLSKHIAEAITQHEIIIEKILLLKLQFNETQTSETKCIEVCWSNYPTCEAKWDYVLYPTAYCGICFQSLLWGS